MSKPRAWLRRAWLWLETRLFDEVAVGTFATFFILAGASVLISTLVLQKILFTEQTFFGSGTDFGSIWLNRSDFHRQWVPHGVIPLWNPYMLNGVPWQTGLHYVLWPPTLLGAFVSNAFLELKISIWFHRVLALLFGAYCLRSLRLSLAASLLGGTIYSFGGFAMAQLYAGHMDNQISTPYLPLCLWMTLLCLRNRGLAWTILAGVAWSLLTLSGHYQLTYVSGWAVFLLTVLTCLLGSAYRVQPLSILRPWARDVRPRQPEEQTAPVTLSVPGVPLLERLQDLGWIGLRWAGIGVVCALLSAFQVLPTSEVIRDSNRAAQGLDYLTSFRIPPLDFLTLAVPHVFEGTHYNGYWVNWVGWEGQIYGSIGGLLLAVAFAVTPQWRRYLPALLVMLLAMLLATGGETPFLKFYYELGIDPLMAKFRVPGRYLLGFTFLIAWLSSLGYQAVCRDNAEVLRRVRSSGVVFLLLFSVLWMFLYYVQPTQTSWFGRLVRWACAQEAWDRLISGTTDNLPRLLVTSYLRIGWAIVLALLTLWTLTFRPRARRLALFALILFDLTFSAREYFIRATTDMYEMPPPVRSFLTQSESTQRIIWDGRWVNQAAGLNVAEVGGYTFEMDPRYSQAVLLCLGQGMASDAFAILLTPLDFHPFFSMQGARYLISAVPLDQIATFYPAFRSHYKPVAAFGDAVFLYEDSRAFPRAWLVHRAEAPGSELRQLVTMLPQSLAMRGKAFVQMADLPAVRALLTRKGPVTDSETKGDAVMGLEIQPNLVKCGIQAGSPALFVMSDDPAPGWTAELDGKTVPILAVNGGLHRGVLVDKGTHSLVLRYFPESLRLGIRISALTWLLVCAFLLLTAWLRPLEQGDGQGEEERVPDQEHPVDLGVAQSAAAVDDHPSVDGDPGGQHKDAELGQEQPGGSPSPAPEQ